MVTQSVPVAVHTSPASLHAGFLALLPRIEQHAMIYFRDIRCADTRADKVAETIALAWKSFVGLARRGKNAAEFPSALAAFAARAVRSGRRVCGQDKAHDVMSPRAQQQHGFKVETLAIATRLPYEASSSAMCGRRWLEVYEERLRDNVVTPVPDQAAFRADFPDFLGTLSERERGLAEFLALGNSADMAARTFGVSPGRVTQIRRRMCRDWQVMQGEIEPDLAGNARHGPIRPLGTSSSSPR
jgi:hypothetical protein